jgi:hypothetical protein
MGRSQRSRATARLVLMIPAIMFALLLAADPAVADPAAGDWQRLRQCESGGRYTANSGNGYYGAYQFSPGTWRSVGGTGLPHQASPSEQDYRALYLYRMRGWTPWSCARKLGLREDRDARTKVVPLKVAPPTVSPGTVTAPPWPGREYDYGACDPGLKTWQLRMNTYGYAFEGTGCYYAKTRDAVLDLQRANGITENGILGPKTWDAAWTGKRPR